MEYLLELQAKTNQITSIAFMAESPDTLKYLQKVDLSQNKITEVPQIQCPSLFNLNLEENEIAKITLNEHTRLKNLVLNKNKLTTCEGMTKLHRLETLSIAENELHTLNGLEELPVLTTLNVSGNKIEKLDPVPALPKLRELILDGNPIASAKELEHLKVLKSLTDLKMAGCPLAEEKGDDFKKEVLIALYEDLPSLKTINGDPFTEEDITEAMAEKENRIREAENRPPEEDMEGEAPEGDE